MERGNTKHGPVQDEEMAHETDRMVHGVPKPGHAEEWRDIEPVDDALPPVRRGDGPSGTEFELRTELARLMTRDWFPADRDALLGRLADRDAAEDVTGVVTGLSAGRRFDSAHDVLVALGLNSPETRRS
jgi:hypothetical protein